MTLRAAFTFLLLWTQVAVALPQYGYGNLIYDLSGIPLIMGLFGFDTSTPAQPAIEKLAPFMRPSMLQRSAPQIRAEALREIVRFGPFELPGATAKAGKGHGHGGMDAKPASGGIMSGKGAMESMDTTAILRGDIATAIAKFVGTTMDPDGFNIMRLVEDGVCRDCTVLGVKLDVVFENGTRADVSSGVYLHHILTLNIGSEADQDIFHASLPFCSGQPAMMDSIMGAFGSFTHRFLGAKKTSVFGFGAVDEFKQHFTTPDGKFDSGFYRQPKDQLFVQAEVVNYREEAQNIYLQADVEFVPGKVGKMATTSFSSATACDKPMVFQGNGTSGKFIGAPMKAGSPGTIISARGHMHDGGEAMSVFLNDKKICDSKASYNTTYHDVLPDGKVSDWTTISTMSECNKAIKVREGDTIRLEAEYNEKAHPPRASEGEEQMEMGLVAFTWVSA